MLYRRIIFLLFTSATVICIKLPPYFNQCSKSDPKLNECIVHNANGGLNAFVKGDKMYNIESLLPLYIPHISLRIDKHLWMNLSNSIITDFLGAKVKNAKFDFKRNSLELSLYIPRATLLGQYNIKGKLSILPIDETGPVNMTIVHSRIKYNWTYSLTERKGFTYMNLTASHMTYKSERIFFTFYDLFSRNKIIGDVINESLNTHWTETNRAIEPELSDALCKITTRSLKGFFDKVPFVELIKD